jgi:Ca2+-transporting ATPase
MFNARSFETGRSFFKVPKSTGFWTIVLIICIGQFIITEFLPDFFNVESFHSHGVQGWIDCAVIIALSSVVLWIRELANLLTPSSETSSK